MDTENDQYLSKKYDYIPISPKLIEHVRRLDGFNEEELIQLKQLLTGLAKKTKKQFSFSEENLKEGPLRKFLEITLKIHQIFALVDVKFESVLTAATRNISTVTHLSEVAEQLAAHNGLNYVPRERTSNGRVFEHAADSKVLIDHLTQL